MRVRYADAATPIHALSVGDRVRERRSGEARSVTGIARTLTEFRVYLDNESYFDAGIFDTAFVVSQPSDLEPDGD